MHHILFLPFGSEDTILDGELELWEGLGGCSRRRYALQAWQRPSLSACKLADISGMRKSEDAGTGMTRKKRSDDARTEDHRPLNLLCLNLEQE